MGIELAVYAEVEIRGKGFSDENLVTEARWERLVFESLLSCKEVDKVYSVLPIWKSSHPKPAKFVDGPIGKKISDLVVISPNSWPFSIKPKGIVLNSYYSSFFNYKEFDNFRKIIKDNFFVINPYENFRKNDIIELETFLEDFFLPRIPIVKKDHKPFDNKIIFWPHKNTFIRPNAGISDLMVNWIANSLEKYNDLQFHVLSGMCDVSLIFFGFNTDIYKHFFSYECNNILKKFRDRVIVHKSLSWSEVLNIYSKSKISLSINMGGSYVSGPALESGMFGVPFVFTSDIPTYSPWGVKLEPCTAEWCSEDYFNLMDKLLTDEIFYNEISNLTKEHVQRYTYESFNKNLLSTLSRRGMI